MQIKTLKEFYHKNENYSKEELLNYVKEFYNEDRKDTEKGEEIWKFCKAFFQKASIKASVSRRDCSLSLSYFLSRERK